MDWSKLRPWKNSKNLAFEEICCQLARAESISDGVKFMKKEAPDGGIEGYWDLKNGGQIGWQAKFFTSQPTASQWGNIKKSLDNALVSHPKLIKFIVCCAVDLNDKSIKKWNDYKSKWSNAIKQKSNRDIEFDYWGTSEIADRLMREQHRGKLLYWFNKDILSFKRMKENIDDIIANVGPRYTKELNIELDIAKYFEALGRTDIFHNQLLKRLGEFKRAVLNVHYGETEFLNKIGGIQNKSEEFFRMFFEFASSANSLLDVGLVKQLARIVKDLLWNCESEMRERKHEEQKKSGHGDDSYYRSDKYDSWIYYLRNAYDKLGELYPYIESEFLPLSVYPNMILTGKAGTGKTHLLCDVARKRVENEYPTVLLLGENFTDDEPQIQIIKQLHVQANGKEEFLGMLNTVGEASNSKALIMIDAINESRPKELWIKHLAGMFTAINRYPWIGLVVSVRGSYYDYLIPENMKNSDKVTIIEHHGFEGAEYKAVKSFFEFYKIEYPSIPLLNPEFSNPQFLKIICQSLKNYEIRKFPRGYSGLSRIYSFFIDSVNRKLSSVEYIDYDKRTRPIHKAIDLIVESFIKKNRPYLFFEEIQAIMKDVPLEKGFSKLLGYLESEQVINKDMYYIENEYKEVFRLSYERFSDHLTAKHYVSNFIDVKDPAKSFQANENLKIIFKDSSACYLNKGLIEALSIQVPEIFGHELMDYVPHLKGNSAITEAFFDSIVWRDPEKIYESTLKCINSCLKSKEGLNSLFETLITVSSIKEHPYNTHFTHTYLMKYPLAERDASWSIYIFYHVGEKGAIDRLIDWALSDEDKSRIDDESIYLVAKMLAWFLTTSQRYLRDWSTKAMVNLLTNKIYLIKRLLADFEKVNDPYVSERLYAVAYGCAMRTLDIKSLQDLAQYVYDTIFKKGCPPVHILLRDYARNIIELALHYKLTIKCNIKKIRPPYKSEWREDFPAKNELESKYCHAPAKDNETLESKALHRLYWIVTNDYSDFNKHYIEHTGWSSRRRGEPKKVSRKEKYEMFIYSLTDEQKKAFNSYKDLSSKKLRLIIKGFGIPDKKIEIGEDISEEEVNNAEKLFLASLDENKRKQYEEFSSYLHNINATEYDPFSKDFIEAYIFNRILELGWSPKLHYEFDEMRQRLNDYDYHSENKPEMISQKYRWIALHEFLARLSDNYEYGDGFEEDDKYLGPWQRYYRDIDPSFVKRKIPDNGKYWWFTYSCNSWKRFENDVDWIRSKDDLPNFEKIIEVTDSHEAKWLNLDCHFNLEEPYPPEEDKYKIARKNIWFFFHSYLVRKKDSDKLFEWAKTQNFMGRWLPEKGNGTTSLFFGEFYWSPAFKYFNTPYYGRDVWIKNESRWHSLPVDVALTTDNYYRESGRDCSIMNSLNITLPAQRLAESMQLSWKGKEGQWFDNNDIVIAVNPIVEYGGPTSFLLKKQHLRLFLDQNELDIIWVMLGEKRKLGGDDKFFNRLILNGVFRMKNDGNFESSYNFIHES
ncbi:MAG: AVAST type 2 anti-phage system protein Avs2 [Sedimentisphaerales bacterium]